MKKYIIKPSVSLDTISTAPLRRFGKQLMKYTIFGHSFLYNAAKNLSCTPISSSEELSNFSNYQGQRWAHDTIYVEHPFVKHLLIPESDSKDILLREVVADISNYILDHISVSELIFGVVKSIGLQASIPITEISSTAKIKCNLLKEYYHHVKNTTCTHQVRDYIWIASFPDIKSAIEHNAHSMENILSSTFDFTGELNGLGIGLKSKLKFYISYIQ